MSKKVLSMVLAVIMVLSAFTVSAFAVANPETGKVGFITTTTAKVGQSSGNVTVDIYYIFPADFDFSSYNHTIGNIVLGYNNAKYEYVENSRVYDDNLAGFLQDESSSPTVLSVASGTGIAKTLCADAKLTTAEKDAGYNAAAQIKLAYVAGNSFGYGTSTGFPLVADKDKKVHVCSVQFTVKGALTAKDIIGVFDSSTSGGQSAIQYRNGSKNAKWTAYVAETQAPAAANPITFVKTQAQWADGNNTVQDTWKLGIVGTFKAADIDIKFSEGGTSTNVTAVGVDVTAGDYTTTETTRFVYDNGDNSYSYRAVVTNIPADVSAEKTITVTFFAMVGGEKVTGETKTINLAGALATAQENGMAKAD